MTPAEARMRRVRRTMVYWARGVDPVEQTIAVLVLIGDRPALDYALLERVRKLEAKKRRRKERV